MFIYNGKLSWFHWVEKEDFTIVVPAGFTPKDPICAYWQCLPRHSDVLHQLYFIPTTTVLTP